MSFQLKEKNNRAQCFVCLVFEFVASKKQDLMKNHPQKYPKRVVMQLSIFQHFYIIKKSHICRNILFLHCL